MHRQIWDMRTSTGYFENLTNHYVLIFRLILDLSKWWCQRCMNEASLPLNACVGDRKFQIQIGRFIFNFLYLQIFLFCVTYDCSVSPSLPKSSLQRIQDNTVKLWAPDCLPPLFPRVLSLHWYTVCTTWSKSGEQSFLVF